MKEKGVKLQVAETGLGGVPAQICPGHTCVFPFPFFDGNQ